MSYQLKIDHLKSLFQETWWMYASTSWLLKDVWKVTTDVCNKLVVPMCMDMVVTLKIWWVGCGTLGRWSWNASEVVGSKRWKLDFKEKFFLSICFEQEGCWMFALWKTKVVKLSQLNVTNYWEERNSLGFLLIMKWSLFLYINTTKTPKGFLSCNIFNKIVFKLNWKSQPFNWIPMQSIQISQYLIYFPNGSIKGSIMDVPRLIPIPQRYSISVIDLINPTIFRLIAPFTDLWHKRRVDFSLFSKV